MLYNPPTGSLDPDAPYVPKNLASGQQGSRVPAKAIEAPQREIVAAILAAGLSPSNTDLTQLAQAIRRLAAQAAPQPALVHRGTNVGSINALAAVMTPAITGYDASALYVVGLAGANTGPTTADFGFGSRPVLRSNGSALKAGDISRTAILTFDGDSFLLANLAQEFAPPGSGFAGSQGRFGYTPAAGQTSLLTATFTPRYAGIVTCFSTLNSSPQNPSISNGAIVQVNGVDAAGAADRVSGASTSVVSRVVAAGDAVAVLSQATPDNASYPFGVSQYLNYLFVPA